MNYRQKETFAAAAICAIFLGFVLMFLYAPEISEHVRKFWTH
jgi:hypothetical protein